MKCETKKNNDQIDQAYFFVSISLPFCLRNQHVKRLPSCIWPAASPSSGLAMSLRIREEALMGDVALNASVKLHEEAAEHAQKARHEQLEIT